MESCLPTNHYLKAEYTIDGVHLTSKAYLLWADKVK
jgi:lysophospholipase L1-like esterase